ncbi:MAG TPA: PKD domain-containing protein [Candidatus Angelobacter sp.]|nr:PKD domain-containing protein [Candidatus Angelobacter sp.]
MVSRVPALVTLVLSLFFATTIQAQTSNPADVPNNNVSQSAAHADFVPAHPFFGNNFARNNFVSAESFASPNSFAFNNRFSAQSTTAAPAPKSSSSSSDNDTHPAGEVFLGYSFIRFRAPAPFGTDNSDLHGGTASIAGNVNRWFGFVGDFADYRVTDPSRTSASFYTFMFGPKFSLRGHRWTPFAQILFGDAYTKVTVPTPPPGFNFFSTASFHANAFATAMGGGLDLTLSKHFAWRVLQAEYLLTKFRDTNNNQQNNIRLATGIVFRFGGGPPPPPPNHPPTISSVSANPDKLTVGDSAMVQAQASDPDNDPLTYTWTSTCGTVEGSGAQVRLNSANVAPGTCTVTSKVDDGRGGTATASTNVTIAAKPNHPPTVSCAASPQSVTAGQPVNLTATGSDPDNDQLTYTWNTTAGKITGSGEQAQLDTTGLAPGHYTVNCKADDGKGGVTEGQAGIDVQAPVEQKKLETRLSLHSIYFPTAQPTVANPSGGLLPSQQQTLKTLAEDFAKYLTFRPDAHLILQGHADPRGSAAFNQALSDRRVARTKDFLVQQGVKADAIDTQAMGAEQPMSAAQVKEAVDQDPNLTPAQKKQLTAKAAVLALAQSRRVDVTLSTTGQTSVRQFPFNAEDALNLINPHGVHTAKPRAKRKGAKGARKKGGATK